jgi:hypothetical protein
LENQGQRNECDLKKTKEDTKTLQQTTQLHLPWKVLKPCGELTAHSPINNAKVPGQEGNHDHGGMGGGGGGTGIANYMIIF